MNTAWAWVVHNADWLSAICGLLSAFVLALPLIRELPQRRRHDTLSRITHRSPSPPAGPPFEDDSADVGANATGMASDRLGGYSEAARTISVGLGLLALSFALALIYAVNKGASG